MVGSRSDPVCGNKQNVQRGFALTELLVAGFFLAVGLLALVGLLVKLTDSEGASGRRVLAAFCAQEKMEELEFEIACGALSQRQGQELLDLPCGQVSRRWKIVPYEEIEGLEEIEVACTYLWKNETKTVALQSLVLP